MCSKARVDKNLEVDNGTVASKANAYCDEEDDARVGDSTDTRKIREMQEETKLADRGKMVALISKFTPEQLDRYEFYRRSNLPKPILKKLFQALTGVFLNQTGLIVLAGVCKMFVGEVVEGARDYMDEIGEADVVAIKPCHIREAHRRTESRLGTLRERRQPFFKQGKL